MLLKIGMLLDGEFPPDLRVENEMRTLASSGFDVHLLCYDFSGVKSKTEKFDQNITIHRIQVSQQFHKKFNPLALTLPFYFSFWEKKAHNFINELDIDIIHIHDLRLAEVGHRIKKNFNIPYVLDLHENLPAGLSVYAFSNSFFGKMIVSIKRWERYEQKQVDNADAVITVIEEMSQRINSLGVAENKIFTVPNYISLNFFDSGKIKAALERKPGEISLFYSGGFDAHRGLDTLIKAMKIVQSKNQLIRLHLIGGGRSEPELKNLLLQKEINNVKFYGWQPDRKLPSFMETCDIGVVPHKKNEQTNNTIPHKLFQYLWKQKPVIVSDCKPLKRLVEEMTSGLVFQSGNSDDLAEKIIQLSENKKLQKELGKNGFNAVVHKYNWNLSSENLLNLYQQILKI